MTTNESGTGPFSPLGILKMALKTIGHEGSHCYDDLVFIEHNAVLLRMGQKGEEVSLFFNTESDIEKLFLLSLRTDPFPPFYLPSKRGNMSASFS